MYADPRRYSESLHGIANRAPTADGSSRTVKDREDLIRDYVYLLPAVVDKLLADKRGVLRSQLKPAAVAERDEPASRVRDVDEEHRRQDPSRREARAPPRIERLERWKVCRQVRDDELEDAFGARKALEAMRTEVAQTQTTG